MRIFSQAVNETVIINGNISVRILDIVGDDVVLAIDAPEWIEVREEGALETVLAGTRSLSRARPR
jgi:carbon storage regulator CsrA